MDASDGWFAGLDSDDREAAVERIREGSASAPDDWPARAVEAGFAADIDDYGTGVYDRENGGVVVHTPPPLQYARSVVALDGTPTPDLWKTAVGVRFNRVQVLTDDERRDYIRDVLNLNLIQTTDAVKPYSSGNYVNVNRDGALIDAIADRHGDPPAVVTMLQAKRRYDDADADVLPDDADAEHYGNLKGSNKFAKTRVGAVVGSPHYGDGYIKRWGALAGRAVERGDGKGNELTYGDFGDRVLRHMRENEVLQAAMRFGRDGKGAAVYVHTSALPEWVPVAGNGRVVDTWSTGMKHVVDAARELDGGWRTADIAARVDLSDRQIREHLHTLADRGVVARTYDGPGYVWADDGLRRVNEHGAVDLPDPPDTDPVDLPTDPDDEITEVSRNTLFTWDFRDTRGNSDREGVAPGDGATPGVDPPPTGVKTPGRQGNFQENPRRLGTIQAFALLSYRVLHNLWS